jgi:ribonuclease T2
VLGLLVFSLLGCNPTDLQDLTNDVSDSATLAATVVKTQPTKKPTRTAAPILTPSTPAGKRVRNTPGDFDFYVLALSWSPDYCANSNVNDPQQCSLGKKLAFVLHGLWPQYNRGYPADCSTVKLPKDASKKYPNLYPSSRLYTHEWSKHGTCSGLKPLDYLALSKSLKESVTIPTAYRSPAKAFRVTVDNLKAAFIDANATLSEDDLAVQCSDSGRFLKEVYVCFSRDGKPVTCSPEIQRDAARSCGRADFLVRNVK